jgi:hypothetical protein
MSVFGIIPPEPPRIHSLDDCAPQFVAALTAAIADVPHAMVFESLRTNERQAWLAGFGHDYDDGRGVVTHAQTAEYGWHFFGLAADVIHDELEWNAPSLWWDQLANAYENHGLTAGARWKMADKPHGQWGPCRTTPSDEARSLYASGGNQAVWDAVGAA